MEKEQRVLSELAETLRLALPGLVSDAFRDVLGSSAFPMSSDQWLLVDRLSFSRTHAMNMGLCNEEWRGLLALGFDERMFGMIPGAESRDMARDAMGEVLNTLGGALAAHAAVVNALGQLVQTPPMHYASAVIYPRAISVQGKVVFSGEEVDFGWACRSALSSFIKTTLSHD